MRTILKIIAAPVVLALMLIVAVLSFLSCIAGAVLRPCVYGISSCWRPAPFSRGCIRAVLRSGAGVPCFPLWAPGHWELAAGSSVRGEICLAGFYDELMTSGHFVQKR